MALAEVTCEITAETAGRADQVAKTLTGRSRADLKGMFHHSCVQVNGQVCQKPGLLLQPGDTVLIRHDPHTRYHIPREERVEKAFRVVFEDDSLLVVDKAADVLTVQTDQGGEDTLVEALTRYLKTSQRQAKAYPVHRLDLGTSGLLVFGKSSEIASALQQQFRIRKADREYAALMAGHVQRDSGTIESRLGTSQTLQRYSVRAGERGELAVTHFQVKKRVRGASLLSVTLETGRRNQIRVHFAELGHPVLGDKRYRPELAAHPRWKYKRLALQAALLGFMHPKTDQPLRFELPLPTEFEAFLRATS